MPNKKLPLPPVSDEPAWDRSADVAQLCALAARLFDEVQKLAPGLKKDLDKARETFEALDKAAQAGEADAYFQAFHTAGEILRVFGHIGLIRSGH